MGKNSTKAEKAKRNLEYAMAHKKRVAPARRFGRPASSPMTTQPSGSTPGDPAVAGGITSQRPMYPAICTTCGAETTVPFEPTTGKPVQCRNCYQPRSRA